MKAIDEVKKRDMSYEIKLGVLALERLRHSQRIEQIDSEMTMLGGAKVENDNARKDIGTQDAVDAARVVDVVPK